MLGWSARPGLAIAVVTCLVVGSLGLVAGIIHVSGPIVGGTHPAGAAATHTASLSKSASVTSSAGAAKAIAIENALRARGISPARIHLPNFPGAVTNRAQPVTPTYTRAPAPMGVADIGLKNVSGELVPYELNTTSVAGTVAITNLQSLYLDGDGPSTYGVQLNSVVAGVTIFGNSSYEFWSQNYVDYTPSTQQLVFGDEVWNFSSLSGYFPQNSIYNFSVNGTSVDFSTFPGQVGLYQGYGPAITIGYPFSLTLYLNTSTLGDRPALWFNYTVSNATFRQSESYDYLVFNSTVGTPTAPAPVPYYQADGYNYDPIGLINDMEIDLLGNDDGDLTAFTAADATMSLQYWNATAHAMQEVPSAFNAGQETGETAVGLSVTSSGTATPYAVVQPGPGFVHGLWNYSAGSGSVAVTVALHPRNAFIFVNVGGTENASGAQWVPSSSVGDTVLYVPTGGTYFFDFLMADRDPTGVAETVTTPITIPIALTVDASQGVYTPLFAMNNAELASISATGTGVAGDPYHLISNQYGSIAPQFAQLDDWLFPVFPGVLLTDVSDWVVVTPPSLQITIPSWEVSPYFASLGLPRTNDLQIQFYDSSNISLVEAAGISGWFSAGQYGFPESEVMLWGCTDVLVASNTFDDEGNGLLLYGGTNNTVWGNTFLPTPVGATAPSSIDAGQWITGVNETESGDLVYNNYFSVPLPAITPIYDPFPCDQYGICIPIAYSDTWNVSQRPAANYSIVNGLNLTGSIIGTWYQGGNYWSNYGTASNPYGVLPYNNSGAITVRGDFVPLIPFALYAVTFAETGLPAASAWSVTVNGIETSSIKPTIQIESPNGTYALTVTAPAGYAVVSAPAFIDVAGSALTVDVTFAPLELVAVEETGLPTDLEWSATVNGTGTGNVAMTVENDTSTIDFELIPGTYNVSAIATGFVPSPAYTHVDVGTSGAVVPFGFTPVSGTLSLTVTPASAMVWVNGVNVTLVTGSWSGKLAAGFVPVEALATGYYPYFTNVTVKSGVTTPLTVKMMPIVTGTLSLTVTPGSAYTYVDGVQVTLVSGAYSVSLTPGMHSIVVVAAGYYTYYNNVTVTSNRTTALAIALVATPSSSSSSGISTVGWAIIALLAALAAIFLVGMLYFARRSRSGGGPPKTPPAQPWQETPPNNPPPSS